MRFLLAVFVFLVSAFMGAGCSWFETKEEMTAQELAIEGMANYEKGNYGTAVELFEKLKDWYPFSKFAILADLKVADAYYKKRDYEDAVFAYEQFENLHPRNEAVPYVLYQIGMCYFEQLDTPDRDQGVAREALKAFQRLIREYPDDMYSGRAGNHVETCIRSLAEHEFYVGLYYYRSKHYGAALARFETVLREYPDVGVQYKALTYIQLCKDKLQEKQES
ncbi:outer membrane protein assembly factor BamD [Thermodesulfobacteriota bacterium]